MLFIFIGITLSALIVGIISFFFNEKVAVIYGVILFLCSIVFGLLYPTQYGEQELVNETQLSLLSDSTYVYISGENVYTYRCEIPTETSKNYETKKMSGKNIQIIEVESKDCKNPVLLEYKTKSKITIWSFGFGACIKEYVFYVPEGTIQKALN